MGEVGSPGRVSDMQGGAQCQVLQESLGRGGRRVPFVTLEQWPQNGGDEGRLFSELNEGGTWTCEI